MPGSQVTSREAHNASVLTKEHRAGQYNESVGTLAAHRGEPTGEIAAQAHSHRIDDRKSPEDAFPGYYARIYTPPSTEYLEMRHDRRCLGP